jgi:mannose-1-phosphate guanylyltransferase
MFQHTLDRADQIVEKCRTAVASGALWNTLVLAARAETLWEVGWQCFPEMMPLFERYGKAVGTSEEESVLESIYEVMPARNFSSHLLERLPQRVAVMELRDVLWSDWGKPERILETLQRIGSDRRFPRCTQPPFSGFCFEELAHGKSGNHGHSGAGRR